MCQTEGTGEGRGPSGGTQHKQPFVTCDFAEVDDHVYFPHDGIQILKRGAQKRIKDFLSQLLQEL